MVLQRPEALGKRHVVGAGGNAEIDTVDLGADVACKLFGMNGAERIGAYDSGCGHGLG